ncbi:MAG: PIN domain-containing protein [Chloroflexota bacterium]
MARGIGSTVILQMIESGDITLVSSLVLAYENSRNPFPHRKKWVSDCLNLAGHTQPADEEIWMRAEEMEQQGLKAIDALHLACAEAAHADYFITCDDEVIRRYREERTKGINPVDFVMIATKGRD